VSVVADETTAYEAINERRQDKAFMDRLAHRVREDGPLLDRLADGECRSARLIESRNGGTVLVYECECGARLTRTQEQAEVDARPDPSASGTPS
jgi:hypothetical protein